MHTVCSVVIVAFSAANNNPHRIGSIVSCVTQPANLAVKLTARTSLERKLSILNLLGLGIKSDTTTFLAFAISS